MTFEDKQGHFAEKNILEKIQSKVEAKQTLIDFVIFIEDKKSEQHLRINFQLCRD
jgi:hypothetical protein